MTEAKPISGKGCWYKIYIEECPVCGLSEETRERQWTPKPDNPEERYKYSQLPPCGSHFL